MFKRYWQIITFLFTKPIQTFYINKQYTFFDIFTLKKYTICMLFFIDLIVFADCGLLFYICLKKFIYI